MLKTLADKKWEVLLVLFALALYANTWTHQYAYDDGLVIVANERVQNGWAGIPDLIYNLRTDEMQGRTGYRPLTLTTFAVEIALFGPNPFWGHFNNTLLYAFLGVLIFTLLKRWLPDKNPQLLFLVVLLFLAHPMHVEVVANIKSRDEMLSLIFGLLAVHQFWQFVQSKDWKPILLSTVFCLLAMLSRENALVFPLVCLLLPFYGSKEISKSAIQKAAFAFIPLAACASIFWLANNSSLLISDSMERYEAGNYFEGNGLGNELTWLDSQVDVWANSIKICFLYLRDFIFPWPLIHDYGFDVYRLSRGFTDIPVLLSIPVLGFFIFFGVRYFRQGNPIGLGLLWFFITISIYLHLVIPGPDVMANRFLFAPSLGLCIALAFAVDGWLKRFKQTRIAPYLTTAILLTFTLLTVTRNPAWATTRTLLEADLPHLERCARAQLNYASVLHHNYYELSEAEKPAAQQQIIKHYRNSIDISNRLLRGYLDLGSVYMEFGYADSARLTFEKATREFPFMSTPFLQLGRYYLSVSEISEAKKSFEKALENGRKNTQAHFYLGYVFLTQQQYPEAAEILHSGLQYDPGFAEYYNLTINAYAQQGKTEEAVGVLEAGIVRFPKHLPFYQQIIAFFEQENQLEKAKNYSQRARENGLQL